MSMMLLPCLTCRAEIPSSAARCDRCGRSLSAPTPGPASVSAVAWGAPLAAILLVGLLLRSWEWTGRGLWFDEAFTWRLVEFPFAEMMDRATRDNSPPFYYVVLHAWIRVFGDSLAALRGLNVLFGLLAVGGMYLFVREAGRGRGESGRGLALFVAALTATSAFQVRYSGEVRPYALGAALAAGSAWALFRAIRPGPPSTRAWVGYGVVTLLLAYTHYYALFMIAGQGVFLAGWVLAGAGWNPVAALRSSAFRHALLAGAVVAAGWAPWVPSFLHQRAQVQTTFWAPPVDEWTVPTLCYQMFVDPQPQPQPQELSHRKILFTALLFAAGLVALGRKARAAEWYVLLAGGGSIGLSVLVSEFDTKTLSLRYFLFAHLLFLSGLGLLVWRIRRGTVRSALVAAVVAGSLAIAIDFLHGLHLADYPGARGAAGFIAARRQPGEPVVLPTPLWYFPVAYHLNRENVHLYDAGGPVVHYEGSAVLTPDDMIGSRELGEIRGPQLWVVNGGGRYWEWREVPVPAGWVLKESHSFPEALRVGRVHVLLYERQSAPGAAGP
ncbi:MAG: hypothetical protein JWO38_1517 [Gemmataceae bacterium]|nr:hypothetical protein [Gemmataceae bacterium]